VPTITFLSDYGTSDEFVGVCHGVIARLCPAARVIDLTHGIGRHDVRSGALALRAALPFMPAGVHLAIVDPEVGAQRRAVALRTGEEERLLVGPDNGLLDLAAERFGGAVEAVDIAHSRHRLEPVSATFHGRDLFAPVAASLAAGAPLAEAGDPLDPADLARLELPSAHVENGTLVTHAVHSDRYGNVELDADHRHLSDFGLKLGMEVELEIGDRRVRGRYARTFAEVPAGAVLLYEDAQHVLALAINRGSAARELGLASDQELRVRKR